MMNKTFLARLAKVAFVLAATLTLNLLITACSRDYSLPDDKPIEKVATVTIDGVVKQVSDIKMLITTTTTGKFISIFLPINKSVYGLTIIPIFMEISSLTLRRRKASTNTNGTGGWPIGMVRMFLSLALACLSIM